MNDALKNRSRDLLLKLHWTSEQQGSLTEGPRVVVELQNPNGLALASMSLPSDQLLLSVSQKLKCYPLMSPTGFVSVVFDETAEILPDNRSIPLNQLVSDAVSPAMLEDEPDAAQMLYKFRQRLLKSLEHVEQAIASQPKP